mmetsp:Transcript_39502/g.70883  ORF Transcript_39502/g.70883 Transcript_39502/m.70883 type:complete len:204 (-) Transcript_39502:629-1240(-)
MFLPDDLLAYSLALCLDPGTQCACVSLRLVCKRFAALPFIKIACHWRWPQLGVPLAGFALGGLATILGDSMAWQFAWHMLGLCENYWRQEEVEDILEARSLMSEDWYERQLVGRALAAVAHSKPTCEEFLETLWAYFCRLAHVESVKKCKAMLLYIDLTDNASVGVQHLDVLQEAAHQEPPFCPLVQYYMHHAASVKQLGPHH